MFTRWLHTRLKAAETALHGGRLDDACERFRAAGSSGPAAQRLAAEIAAALLARARLSAEAGRAAEALSDLDRRREFAPDAGEAAALRQRILNEQAGRVARQAHHREIAAEVHQQLADGRLDTGRVLIDQVADPAERERLRGNLHQRLHRAHELLEQARASLQAGDVHAACRSLCDALLRHGRTAETLDFAAKVAPRLTAELDDWLRSGRLDRHRASVQRASAMIDLDPRLVEHQRLSDQFVQAAAELAGGAHVALRQTLLRASAALPDAPWLREALDALGGILSGEERLLRSPLGLLDGGVPPAAPLAGLERAAPPPASDALPLGDEPLLLLVDGAGSSLLAARAIVRIGRAGAAPVELPLPAGIQSHHAEIVREGEDCFLVARGPTRLNGRDIQRSLLRDGDRIVLSDSAKLSVLRPSAKSETVVLRLADRCRAPLDVHQVLLFRGVCLVGPHPSCHVRTREGQSRVVLLERGGRLHARLDDGARRSPSVPVRAGETLDLGDVRLTVKPYRPREAAGPGA